MEGETHYVYTISLQSGYRPYHVTARNFAEAEQKARRSRYGHIPISTITLVGEVAEPMEPILVVTPQEPEPDA